MDDIKALARTYQPQVGTTPIWPRLQALSRRFARQSVIDSAAAALALDALLNNDQIPISELTPQMREAFHLAYPHKDLATLASGSPSDMDGFLSAWRGKLFEVMVRDKLNNGETVATLRLGPGEVARLAESATQPGWDLEFISNTGDSIAKFQLKATESLSYVNEHVSRYPDIPVLVTANLDVTTHSGAIARVDDVLNSNLVDQVHGAVDHLHAPQQDDWLAGLPWALIFATQTWGVVSGKQTTEQAVTGIVERSVRTGFWMAVAKVASLVDPVLGTVVLAARVIAAIGSDETVEPEPDAERREAIRVAVTQLITVPNRLLPCYKP